MPRKRRVLSSTGVYHVMLRGINREDIFTDEQDCLKFIKILAGCVAPTDKSGNPLPPMCTIYGYCLMSNHVHLLIGERDNSIGEVLKSIGITYVSYFNKRHYRIGPMFQGRFRSEPVEDALSFFNLLRYIHENPVAACICAKPGEYRWSSWHEYESAVPLPGAICSVTTPFTNARWDEYRQQVLESCTLTRQPGAERARMTDKAAEEVLMRIGNNTPLAVIKSLSFETRKRIILEAMEHGVGSRQMARITGIPYNTISRIRSKSGIK